jgi:hypothetical protein
MWGKNAELFNVKLSAMYVPYNHRTSRGYTGRFMYLFIKCLHTWKLLITDSMFHPHNVEKNRNSSEDRFICYLVSRRKLLLPTARRSRLSYVEEY